MESALVTLPQVTRARRDQLLLAVEQLVIVAQRGFRRREPELSSIVLILRIACGYA
jgi:hypothetical protein